jgi:pimeloyl-ACP methyl ester carboxylesterase
MDQDAAPTRSSAPHAAGLPPPVAAAPLPLTSLGQPLQAYVAGSGPPMLLVHSVNAAASAAEIAPLLERYRATHTVFCVDLPGFGASSRADRAYTPDVMVRAVLDVLQAIAQRCPGQRVHVLGLSLSCEYVARAALQAPALVASLALVSPTGMARSWPAGDPAKGHLGKPWLLAAFGGSRGRTLFAWLTRPSVIRYFLRRTWGSRDIDEGLAEYDWLTARQPGARFAPYHFVSGYLFTPDIFETYRRLDLPVWVSHGTRGDFVDYSRTEELRGRPDWRVQVFEGGALPHFEQRDAFLAAYDGFLAGLP